MRRKALVDLLNDLRIECGLSVNPAHNVQVQQKQIQTLQRTQERLWDDFDWPFLRVERQYPAAIGQRYYDWSADFDIQRIESIFLKSNGGWMLVRPGIGQEEYLAYDSDLDQRGWPPRRWKISETEQVEIWPISDQAGNTTTRESYFKVIGIRKLQPLVDDNDLADLDDQLIVLYSAFMLIDDEKMAGKKLAAYKKRFAKITSDQTPRRSFKMFGIGEPEWPRRPVINHYKPPGS